MIDYWRKLSIGVCILYAIFQVIFGLPRVINTDHFYRPPGQVDEYSVWLFPNQTDHFVSEVSLVVGQSHRIRVNNTRRPGCVAIQTEYGRSSVRVQRFWPGTNYPITHPCHGPGAGSIEIRNGDRSQVIRFQHTTFRMEEVLSPSEWRTGTTYNLCPRCTEMPTFGEISSRHAIAAAGKTHLAFAGLSAFAAFVLVIGYTAVAGFLYDTARVVLPSKRAKRVKQAFEKAKATGKPFETQATHAYSEQPTGAFRKRQDVDDLRDTAAKIKAETERVKQAEAKVLKAKRDEVLQKENLTREYEAAVKRVRELQEKIQGDQDGN